MDKLNDESISFAEGVKRQHEIHARLQGEIDDALKANSEDSIVIQLMRLEVEYDELKAKIKAFFAAFEAELAPGLGISLVADFDNYWWPCNYYETSLPDGMAQRYQALMALWNAVQDV